MNPGVVSERELNSWIPPDGLDRCRPRQVRLSAAGKGTAVLAGVLLAGGLIGGILLGLVASRQAEDSRLLRLESATTEGLVTRLWRGGDENRQLWISYVFSAGGQVHQQRAKLAWPTWRILQTGSRIIVHYLPSRPELNYPLDAEPRPMPQLIPFVAAIAFAAPGLFLVLILRLQARLLAEGRAALAQVTKLSKFRSDKGRYVYVDFSLLSGAVFKGKVGPVKKPPDVGSRVTVVYDPERPNRIGLYPFALVSLRDRRPLR